MRDEILMKNVANLTRVGKMVELKFLLSAEVLFNYFGGKVDRLMRYI